MNGDSGVWAHIGIYQVGTGHGVKVTWSKVIDHHDMYRRLQWVALYLPSDPYPLAGIVIQHQFSRSARKVSSIFGGLYFDFDSG